MTDKEFESGGRNAAYILLWYFASFILGMMYQGSLFSCLTAFVIPNVPTTLVAALNQKIPIVTTSFAFEGEVALSVLKHAVLKDLRQGLKPEDPLNKYLVKLDASTTFLNAGGANNGIQIVYNMSKGLQIRSDRGSTVLFTHDQFGILEQEGEYLDSLSDGISIFAPNHEVIKTQEMTPFTSRIPWYGTRNFLFPLFHRSLGQLEQSGIFAKWAFLSDLDTRLFRAKKVLTERQYKLVYSKASYDLKNEIIFREANPVSLRAVGFSFALCAMMFGVSIIVFVLEHIKHIFYWKLSPQLSRMYNAIVTKCLNNGMDCLYTLHILSL